jgi:hypothetical protein
MAKKKRGNKNQLPQPQNQPKPGQVVINDFSIEARYQDTSRKNLNEWRQAYDSAVSLILPTRKLLYDLYDDVCLDDHLTSVMGQRRLSVTNTTISFLNEGDPVDSINAVIDSDCFDDLIEHAIDTRFYGYSLVHADFRNNLTELVPRAHVKPLERIVVKDPYDTTGIDFADKKYSTYYAAIGKPKDLGLLIIAAVLVIIKRGNLSDWAQFNELFGQPLRKGKYNQNMPGQKQQLLEALEMAGASPWIVIPDGSEVDFVEANKSGTSDTYNTLYGRMEKGLSKLIVGQTMTTEDGSSKSQGEVHERVAEGIAKSDRLFLTRFLNGTVRRMLIEQGYPEAANGQFQFVDEESTISKDKRLTMDLSIHSQVAPIKKEYFETEYNVEFDQEEIKKREQEKEAAPQPPAPGKKQPESTEKTKLALSFLDHFTDFFGLARQ